MDAIGDEDSRRMMRFVERGDEGAFRTLVEKHRGMLVNYLARLCRDRDLAEDLAQQVFTKLYEHREQFRPQYKFVTYIVTIARNLHIDHLRRVGRRPNELSLDATMGAQDDGSTYAAFVVDSYRTPQTAAHRGELMDELQRAIDRLPDEQRQVFLLSNEAMMSYPDIAKLLDIPVGTVKSRMFHAVRKLKDQLVTVGQRHGNA